MGKKQRQRGFVLVAALALAILYFLLMELVLMDASRALAEAQRFRSRTIAAALAENGAELAAQDLVNGGVVAPPVISDSVGDVTGTKMLSGDHFELKGYGKTKGVIPQAASVTVEGRINRDKTPPTIAIDFAVHTQ